MDEKELEKELEERIAEAKKTGIGDFSNLGLTEIPPGLFDQLGSLSTLDLNNNQLAELPPGLFDQLGSLSRLRLDNNQLVELPPGLFDQLASLSTLDLDSNQLAELPPGIFDQLGSLSDLDLQDNRLAELPPGIFDQLTSLSRLCFYSNQLAKLPPGLFDQLGNLSMLDFDSNQLAELPPGIFDELESLDSLELQDNRLAELPPGIFDQLASLKTLHLNENQLVGLPPGLFDQLGSLSELYFFDNQLAELPPGLFDQLDSLSTLNLSGNPLPTALFAVFESGGIEGLRQHLSSQEEKAHYEGKILLVGEGAAGKTTLVKALENLQSNRCEGETQRTHATEIHPTAVPHPDENSPEIKINCWDFGGQADYRPAHQLFFSSPAIYLIVYDAREGADKGMVDEWLRRIQERSGGEKKARVLVVGRIDVKECKGDPIPMPPTQEQQGRYKTDFEDLVCGYYTVDSKDGYGIPELREAIVQLALRDDYFKQHFEKGWKDVRNALTKSGHEVVSREAFGKLCAAAGLEDPEAIERFASIHHILGHLIYFSGDEELSETVILKPDWLSQAIGYVLIDDDIKQKGLGIASQEQLAEIWTANQYDACYHELFIELMERYELSFREGDSGHALVASLVQADRPAEKFAAAWPEELPKGMREQRVIFRWKKIISDKRKPVVPIPEAFFFTLIARFHLLSLGIRDLSKAVHWAQGLVLKHEMMGDALLEVRDGDLHVVVRGVSPTAMVGFLRLGIEQPHARLLQSFRGLERDYLPTCSSDCEYAPGSGTTTESLLRQSAQVGGMVSCNFCNNFVSATWFEATAPDVIREIRMSEQRVKAAITDSRDAIIEAVQDGQRVEQEKLDQLIASAQKNQEEMHELSLTVERMFQRLYRDLTSHARKKPWLFWARPADSNWFNPSDWVEKKWIIYLYCEHNRFPVTGLNKGKTDVGVYEHRVPKEGYAKFLQALDKVRPLLYLANAVGAGLGAGFDASAMFKGTKGVFDAAAASEKWIGDPSATEIDQTAGALSRILEKQDPDLKHTGLTKVYDNVRGYMWVHPLEKKRYDPGAR